VNVELERSGGRPVFWPWPAARWLWLRSLFARLWCLLRLHPVRRARRLYAVHLHASLLAQFEPYLLMCKCKNGDSHGSSLVEGSDLGYAWLPQFVCGRCDVEALVAERLTRTPWGAR
jgi:hypothetical protein